jgi:hypothetical protein
MKSYSNFLCEAVEPAQNAWSQWLKNNPQATKPGGKFHNDEARDKAAKEFMKTFQKTGKAPDWAAAGQSTQAPPRQAAPQPEPPKPKPAAPKPAAPTPNRAASFAKGAGRFGLAVAADVGTELAIDKIQDPKTRERVRGAKELAVGALTPAYSAASISSGAPASRSDIELENPFGQGGKIVKDFTRGLGRDTESWASWLRTNPGSKDKPEYNDPKRYVQYIPKGSEYKDGVRVGAAKQGGEITPVRWGSVAGEKKVGTTLDVQAKAARERMRAAQAKVPQPKRVYGGRQGSAVTGLGGPLKVDTKANTITTKGKTAKLPSTQILPGGRVGDLAYRNGKPVYLARASMAQRGNQSLLARLSRATGIGGQRQRDAAALAKERQTAMANTQRYRQQLGVTGTGASINPNKK